MHKEWIARRRIRSRVKRRTYVISVRVVVVVHNLNVCFRRLLTSFLLHKIVQTSPPKISRCSGPIRMKFNHDNDNNWLFTSLLVKVFSSFGYLLYEILEKKSAYIKVATTFVVGQPMTKLVSTDLLVSATSSIWPAVSQSSLIFTICFSLKFPLLRAFAIRRRSVKRKRCLSWDCMP